MNQTPAKIQQEIRDIWAEILKREDIGMHESFTELGGYSLLGIQLISRLRQKFSIDLNLSFFLDHPTIEAQSEAIAGCQFKSNTAPLHRRFLKASPLSFAQERAWFLEQLTPGLPLYNQVWAVEMEGSIDLNIFEEALNSIIERHEILRSSIEMIDDRPVLCVHENRTVKIRVVQVSELQSVEAREWIDNEAQKIFDLSRDALIRGSIFLENSLHCVFVLVLHHLVCDGLSMEIFFRELSGAYQAFLSGLPAPFFPLKIQYSDFVAWQRESRTDAALEEDLAFWKNHLIDKPEFLNLPSDRLRPPVLSGKGSIETFQMKQIVSEEMRRISIEEGVTPFQILLAAFGVLLYRWTGQEELLIGIAVAQRDHSELEGLIGRLNDTQVVYLHLGNQISFRSLLKQVRETFRQIYSHRNLPFQQLIEELRPERARNRIPLFQVVLNWRTWKSQIESMELDRVVLKRWPIHTGSSREDLAITFVEKGAGLSISAEYSSDLFDGCTIRNYLQHFELLLSEAALKPDVEISTLRILSESEEQQILIDWNATTVAVSDKPFIRIFEEAAQKHPSVHALVFNQRPMSYTELNSRANQLGRRLQEKAVGPGARVAICLEPGIHWITSVLAVWKLGATYVPLERGLPADRLRYLLAESEPALLITESEVMESISGTPVSKVILDQKLEIIDQTSGENFLNEVRPSDLAYLMYTSGSSGMPKGVLIEQRSVTNLFEFQNHFFRLSPGARVLQFAPIGFDASIWEILTLGSGASLVIYRKRLDLLGALQQNKITHVTLSSTVLAEIPANDLPDLKVVMTGMEEFPREVANRWRPGRLLFNGYGPTEATVFTTVWEMKEECIAQKPPIGKPIPNARVYILDEHRQPLPIGVIGEIYLAGIPLARDFWKNPSESKDRFFEISLPDNTRERVYRTGDMARWLPNGDIEYAGRADKQIKIRGIRIEPAEIEAVLRTHPGVTNCVVITRDQHLIAYVTGSPNVNSKSLRDYTIKKLPRYLIPSLFLFLEELPVNARGKIDRTMLPVPSFCLNVDRFTEPRNEMEHAIARAWKDVLKIEKLGIHDNFFEIGGQSLLATQVIVRLRDLMKKEIPLALLFDYPTISELSEQLLKE